MTLPLKFLNSEWEHFLNTHYESVQYYLQEEVEYFTKSDGTFEYGSIALVVANEVDYVDWVDLWKDLEKDVAFVSKTLKQFKKVSNDAQIMSEAQKLHSFFRKMSKVFYRIRPLVKKERTFYEDFSYQIENQTD